MIKKSMTKKIFSVLLMLTLILPVMQITVFTDVLPGNPAYSRVAAAETMVLLENNDVLPLKEGAKVAMFGRPQIDFLKGGGGSGDTEVPYNINLLQGMQNKEKEGKVTLNPTLVSGYTNNTIGSVTESLVTEAAKVSDVAIVVISRNSTEGRDRSAGKGDYLMSDSEIDMINKVAAGFSKVAIVMNIGGVVDMTWADNYNNIAILMCWQAGMEGGNATADVLCGDVNPSGKLTDTYARSYADYPSSNNFGFAASSKYEEDIYVGYRYFETADPNYEKVKYEFGHGKSYTDFTISDKSAEVIGDEIVVKATVTNNGSCAGKEVVQVYYSAPNGALNKPGKELAAFAKTKELAIGESQTLEMRFAINDMASYDDLGKTGHESAYVLEVGNYNVYVGNSIKDAGVDGAIYTYTQDTLEVTEQLTKRLAPVTFFERLIDPTTGEKEAIGETKMVNVSPDGVTTINAVDDIALYSNNIRFEEYDTNKKCVAYYYTGEEISYKVNVEKAGKYAFVMSYACGHVLTDCIDIYVNNVKVPDISVNMRFNSDGNIGQYYNFEDSDPYAITLDEGESIIKLKAKMNSGNLALFKLTPIDESTEVAPVSGQVVALNENPDMKSNESTSIFPASPIKLSSVYKGDVTMEDFMGQMSDEDVVYLLKGRGKTSQIGSESGPLGNVFKYGIPAVETTDGPAGINTHNQGTAWPVATALASSWDVDLIESVGKAIGKEAVYSGADIWLAPGMNIHRNPLCGRNFEYFSEDPVLTGKIASVMTKGFQSEGVGVTIKHFIANNQETNRSFTDSIASERALREIYLRGFEIAVKESEPWCVMTTYNLLNGTRTSESYDLCTAILRGEWGYEGMVMSDWGSESHADKDVAAGNDIKMPWDESGDLMRALEEGTLQRSDLERSLARVLNLIMKTPAFLNIVDDPSYGETIIHEIKNLETSRIKAVLFAETNEGPRPEICTDEDGGKNMAFLEIGGMMTYYVDVETSGYYKVNFRTASNAGLGWYELHDRIGEGTVKLGAANAANTGGWQKWATVQLLDDNGSDLIYLAKGEHILDIKITQGGTNLNWFEFTLEEPDPISDNISKDENFEIKVISIPADDSDIYDPSFSIKKIGEEAELTVIVASYDAVGRLVDYDMESKIVGTSSTVIYSPSINKASNAVKFKFFIWNSDFVPLTEITSIGELAK